MQRLALLALLVSSTASAVPLSLHHQGRMMDATGVPLDGTYTLHIKLYDQAAGGTAFWSEDITTDLDAGYYALKLGETLAMDTDEFRNRDNVWLGIAVDTGAELSPRAEIASVPFAFRAAIADSVASGGGPLALDGVSVGGTTVIDGSGNIDASRLVNLPMMLGDLTCVDGEVALYSTAGWGCVGANAHNHDAADITEGLLSLDRVLVGTSAGTLAAGNHEHDGAVITSGTVDVAHLPVGTLGTEVARGDHSHDIADLTGDVVLPEVTTPPTETVGSLTLYAKEITLQGGADSSNVLLVHSDSAQGNTTFTDSSDAGHVLTAAGPMKHTASEQQFGDTSMDFRSGAYFTSPSSPDWSFPGDFTIDFWIKLNSVPYSFLVVHRDYGTWTTGAWHIYLNSNGVAQLNFTASNVLSVQTGPAIPLDTWTHVACVRKGSVATVYFDGVNVGEDTSAAGSISGHATQLRVGDLINYSGDSFDGYMDELRITKGVARWDADFTPPASPYDAGGTEVGLFVLDGAGVERKVQLVDH